MKSNVKILLEQVLTEAKVDDNIGLIKQVLTQSPNLTFKEILDRLGVKYGSSQQVPLYFALTAGLKSGELDREKDGKVFRYVTGNGTPAQSYVPKPKPERSVTPVNSNNPTVRTAKTPKIGKREQQKQALLQQIKNDFRYFRPGRHYMEQGPEIEGNSVSYSFRGLGNWVHDEENAYYRRKGGGDDWREDDDSKIWAKGEYNKYMKFFKEFVSNYSWKKYVNISLNPSEKDWCYFEISLKK